MKQQHLDIVILGLSITSSWGNGHATTFRGLVRELSNIGHDVVFLERDVPWYASQRDLPEPPYCKTFLYKDLHDLKTRFSSVIEEADLVIVGSYVPEGVEVGHLVTKLAQGLTAFYDIDTPVTLAKLSEGDYEYLHPDQISNYSMYLSFTGGPILERIEKEYGSPMARPFYCSFDPQLYFPEKKEFTWDLGYLGTYSSDRQPPLKSLMLDAAEKDNSRKYVVAGPQYPEIVNWPGNVERIEHLPPARHRLFYNSQRFTMNITRADMVRAGYSPSVRLFEAAACGTPIISDYWQGIETIFEPGKEILISRNAGETLSYLSLNEQTRQSIGNAAREKVMKNHTAAHRAAELVKYYNEAFSETPAQQQTF